MTDQLVTGQTTELNMPAVRGDGITIGVAGTAQDGWGVSGESKKQVGVRGFCEDGWGVAGESKTQVGVRGYCAPGWGVAGESVSDNGVFGKSQTGRGVYGSSDSQAGVVGESNSFDGVFGISHSNLHAAVSGHNTAGGMAGFFDGDVVVTGDVKLTGADFAEEFDILEAMDVEPGTVMVFEQEGTLQPCQQAYDKRAAGVISGAGVYKPGIVLDKQQSSENRMPVALVGKVYCKVDARYASIEVGDLLTTSDTLGHAMKASDPLQAFGAVIGKALRPLEAGQGLIPIIVALQ